MPQRSSALARAKPVPLRVRLQGVGGDPATKPKGGQFVLQAKALHANLFDGHTLGPVIAELEALTGIETRRIHVDKGYRGHNHAQKFRVWIIGQVRRITAPIAARCAAAPPSSLSLATSRPSTGWAAIISKAAAATASMARR